MILGNTAYLDLDALHMLLQAPLTLGTLGLTDIGACNRLRRVVLGCFELAYALDSEGIDARHRLRRVVRKRMGLEFVVERIGLVEDVLRRSLFINLGDLQM